MRKWLTDKNTVPPLGFRYTDPESQMLIEAPSWKDLVARVKSHKIANQFPIQLNIEDDIEAQLAAQLPENFVTNINPNRSPEIPKSEWPAWAKLVALKALPEDRGVGDTIARTIGPIGGDRFKAWFHDTFNRSCGCSERQDAMNLQYPYHWVDGVLA